MGDSSPVHYSNVNCDGTEPGLADCERDLASPSMTHNSDVYIVCLPRFRFRYTGIAPINYSGTSDKGPSEKRTASLKRTSQIIISHGNDTFLDL